MNQLKKYIYPIWNGIYLVITLLFDAYAYQRLPDTIATQFSAQGGVSNTMPKLTYMLITAGILLLLFLFGYRKDKIAQMKSIAVSTIIVIANIVILAIQL